MVNSLANEETEKYAEDRLLKKIFGDKPTLSSEQEKHD